MKSRKPLLTLLASGSLLFAGALLAQNQPAPPPPTQSMQTVPSTSPSPPTQSTQAPVGKDSTRFNSPQGEVTINSTIPATKNAGPPPDFAQLAGGKSYVTEDDAAAYPPLANDFLHASSGKNRLTKAQYENWLKHH
ncbi:hypothetical protein [Dyella subtropica]|uniref:hypothetical protein n=1 Tax=Dyella subtropica TaxID=2992127 RepID=UPI00224F9E05|nr:hypothetical protein [Dyella subtropica]